RSDGAAVVGVGLLVDDEGRQLQRPPRPAPVRLRPFTADAAVDAGDARAVAQGVSPTEAVVSGAEDVDADAFIGRIAGAGLQQADRAIRQCDHDGAKAVRADIVQGRQGYAHTVIDSGVQQSALQFGDVFRIVA